MAWSTWPYTPLLWTIFQLEEGLRFICASLPHVCFYHLGIKISGSTIEAYTPPIPSEIRSFVKCVLPKKAKGIGTMIKNWIVYKLSVGRPVNYPEIFQLLDQEFNMNPQTQDKFPEIV